MMTTKAVRLLCAASILLTPALSSAAEFSAPAPVRLPSSAVSIELGAQPSLLPAAPQAPLALELPQAAQVPHAPARVEAAATALGALTAVEGAQAGPRASREMAAAASFDGSAWRSRLGRALPTVAAVAATLGAAVWAVHTGHPAHMALAVPGLVAGLVASSGHSSDFLGRLEGKVEAGEMIQPSTVEAAARQTGASEEDVEAALETLRARHQLARFSNGLNFALNLDEAAAAGTKARAIEGLALFHRSSIHDKVRGFLAIHDAFKEEKEAVSLGRKPGIAGQMSHLFMNAGFDILRLLAEQKQNGSVMAKEYLRGVYIDKNHAPTKPSHWVAGQIDKLAQSYERQTFASEPDPEVLLRGSWALQGLAEVFQPKKPEPAASSPASASSPSSQERPQLALPAASGAANFAAVARDDERYKALHEFGTNITALAAEGHMKPLIGRRKELRQMLKTLMREEKNNPLVVGDKGVGKTAVVEGLAQLIAKGSLPADESGPEIKLPEKLKGKNIFRLNLTKLTAGTTLRGQFEERVQKVLDEVVNSNGKIILFIDEVHQVLGLGSAEGTNDLSQALLEAMARPGFSLIGATTLDKYRKIEKDGALNRRFNPVMCSAPSQNEAVAILRGLKSRYEKQHGVTIADETIKKAVKQASRYITDRNLPDSALDLLDDAAAEVELKASEDKQAGKEPVTKVTPEDIDKEIALRMDIPAQNVSEDDRAALKALPEKLEKRLVGQPEAIKAVVRAVRKGRLGYKDPNQPDSFLFLGPTGVGKTELAKTLAKVLFGSEKAMTRIDMSEFMEKHNVARLIGAPPGYVGYEEGGQLTEPVRRRPYQVLLLDEIDKAHPDAFNVLLQVIEDGRLTDGNGRTVDFKNVILIMTANFLGAHTGKKAKKKGKIGFEYPAAKAAVPAAAEQEAAEALEKQAYIEDLKEKLRPEAFNRIGERRVVVFNELKPGHLEQIVAIKEGDLNERLTDKKMMIKLTDAAKKYLVDDAYSETNRIYGARPIKQAIEEELNDALSEAELNGLIGNGDSVTADYDPAARKWVVKKAE